MTDLMPDQHPEQDVLQRWADGDLDPVSEAGHIAHVEACPTCRDEGDALRRMSARLSLSSAPPADLFERIKARREAGERVLLPTGPSPSEQGAAARAASAAHPRHRRRSWGWVVGPLAAAAAVLLVARLTVQEGRPGGETDDVRGVAVEDSIPGRDSPPGDSARIIAPASSSATRGAESGAMVSLRETREGLVVRLAAAAPTLNPRQVQALDSAMRVLREEPARRAIIRYVDPGFNRESASWQLAQQAADHFALGGIDPARVRLVRVQEMIKTLVPVDSSAIEVVVQ